jgi:hypothetical protein
MMHRYSVTVQPIGQEGADSQAVRFVILNHDNILDIIGKVRANAVVPEAEVEEFVVGLKMFTEVLLRHRKSPLFAELLPHVKQFMSRLKQPSGGAP